MNRSLNRTALTAELLSASVLSACGSAEATAAWYAWIAGDEGMIQEFTVT